MDWSKFKDPVCCPSLVGNVVTFWFLTQEAAGSFLEKKIVTELIEFQVNFR